MKCSECGKDFESAVKSRLICYSDECRKKRQARKMREYAKRRGGWGAIKHRRMINRFEKEKKRKRSIRKDPESLSMEFVEKILKGE